MENKNYYTIIIALLGAAKLVLDSFGIKLITDQNVNDVANSVATIITFVGVIMTHIKGRPDFKALFLKLFKKNAVSVPIVAPVEAKPTEIPAQPATPTLTVAPASQPVSTNAPTEQKAQTQNTVQK
jgi:uncharacterized membrane protein